MIYPLSYWNKGDLVALQRSTIFHHFRNHIFVYMRPYTPEVAVLYCIKDGTTVYMHAKHLREPKKQ